MLGAGPLPNGTTFEWQGEWSGVYNMTVMDGKLVPGDSELTIGNNATRNIPYAYGKRGAKVSTLLPPNATWTSLWSQMKKGNELTITLDPPPLTGPNPFTTSTDALYGPSATYCYIAQLDHTVQHYMTMEVTGEEGAYFGSLVAVPYDGSRYVNCT